jgi:hypothetical protein
MALAASPGRDDWRVTVGTTSANILTGSIYKRDVLMG